MECLYNGVYMLSWWNNCDNTATYHLYVYGREYVCKICFELFNIIPRDEYEDVSCIGYQCITNCISCCTFTCTTCSGIRVRHEDGTLIFGIGSRNNLPHARYEWTIVPNSPPDRNMAD